MSGNTALLKKILTNQNEVAKCVADLNTKLDNFTKQNGLTGGKQRKVKDPNAPSRPRSAWIYYYSTNSKQFREDHPDLSQKDITTAMSKDWKKMSDKQKAKYNKLAEKDRERYQTEMAAYNKTKDSGDNTEETKPAPKKNQKKPAPKKQAEPAESDESEDGSDGDSIDDLSLSVSE